MASKKSRPKAANIPDDAALHTLDENDPANHFPLRTLADYTVLAELLVREGMRPMSNEELENAYAGARFECEHLYMMAGQVCAMLDCIFPLVLSGKSYYMGSIVEKDGRNLLWRVSHLAILQWQMLGYASQYLAFDLTLEPPCGVEVDKYWPREPFKGFGRAGRSCAEVICKVGESIQTLLNWTWLDVVRNEKGTSDTWNAMRPEIVLDAKSPHMPPYNNRALSLFKHHPLAIKWQKEAKARLRAMFPEKGWPVEQMKLQLEEIEAVLASEYDKAMRRIDEAEAREKAQKGQEPKDLMTTKKVLEQFATTKRTLLRWAKEGKVKPYKGKTDLSENRYSREEIAQYAEPKDTD